MMNAHMYMISNKRFDIGETTRVVGSGHPIGYVVRLLQVE